MTDVPANPIGSSPRLSRRQLMRALGLSAAALGLAGCAGPPPAPSPAKPAAPAPTAAPAAPVPTAAPAAPAPAKAPAAPAPTAAPAVAKKAAKDSLTVAVFSEPSSANAITEWADIPASQTVYNVFNSLVWLNPHTRKVEPELATSWTQKDPTTWAFKLREGVQFHKDFGEFTAEDAEFNINYTVEQNKPRKFLYFFVKGAKAIDKYNLEIYLERPFAPFMVTMPPGIAGFMVSKKAYQQMGEDTMNRSPVGTGPFELESWKAGTELLFKRHAKYWKQGFPKIQKLSFRPITDPTVKFNLLRTGEIDFLDAPDYKDIATARQNPDLVVNSTVGWNWDYVNFNETDPSLPVAKQEVRQAIAYAIDREAIVKNVYYGEAESDDDMLPNKSAFLGAEPDQQYYPNTADVAKAKELLAKAGHPNGFQISCITSDKPTLRRELELIASQLSKVGIQIQIQNLDMGTYNTRWRGNKFEMALEDITIMTPDSDSAMYWFVHTGTLGDHGHKSPEIDRLLDEARIEHDDAKRTDMYRKVIALVQAEAPYIYTVHSNFIRMWRKGLAGYVPSPQDIDFRLDTVYWES